MKARDSLPQWFFFFFNLEIYVQQVNSTTKTHGRDMSCQSTKRSTGCHDGSWFGIASLDVSWWCGRVTLGRQRCLRVGWWGDEACRLNGSMYESIIGSLCGWHDHSPPPQSVGKTRPDGGSSSRSTWGCQPSSSSTVMRWRSRPLHQSQKVQDYSH